MFSKGLTPKILSDPIWVASLFEQPLTYPYIISLALIFCVIPHSHKGYGTGKSFGTFSLKISNCLSILIRSYPMSHVLPCYPILILSSLEYFSAMNSILHFLHIYRLDFYSKKKILPSNVEKIL
jgi:hypothetical protein